MDYPINTVGFELCFHVLSDSPNAYNKSFYVTDLLLDKKYTWPTASSEDITPTLSYAQLFASEHGFNVDMVANSSAPSDISKEVCIGGSQFQTFFKETENTKTLGITMIMNELKDGTCVH